MSARTSPFDIQLRCNLQSHGSEEDSGKDAGCYRGLVCQRVSQPRQAVASVWVCDDFSFPTRAPTSAAWIAQFQGHGHIEDRICDHVTAFLDVLRVRRIKRTQMVPNFPPPLLSSILPSCQHCHHLSPPSHRAHLSVVSDARLNTEAVPACKGWKARPQIPYCHGSPHPVPRRRPTCTHGPWCRVLRTTSKYTRYPPYHRGDFHCYQGWRIRKCSGP